MTTTGLLFDEMLKHTATMCRIFGIDSEYLSGKNDTKILDEARISGRIFITRDQELFGRATKEGMRCVILRSDVVEEQIAQIIKEADLVLAFPDVTRCARCNGDLMVVGKESVAAEVPKNVLEHNNEFWKCSSCQKIYWKGGHWINIMKSYERIRELLST